MNGQPKQKTVRSPTAEGPPPRIQRLAEELLESVEARMQLDAGFKGMGVNIVVEQSNGMSYRAKKLRAALDVLRAVPSQESGPTGSQDAYLAATLLLELGYATDPRVPKDHKLVDVRKMAGKPAQKFSAAASVRRLLTDAEVFAVLAEGASGWGDPQEGAK